MRPGKAVLSTAIAVLIGCTSEDSISGRIRPNSPPDTDVTASPPEPDTAGFLIGLNWSGSDSDGALAGFEWRMSNNGADGMVDVEDTLEAVLPWQFTTVADSTFEVSAELDSFPDDVDDPSLPPRDYRFWQTHTFFVRAVDDRGALDPTPAHVSFTATTLAPTVRIDWPDTPIPPTCIFGPRVLTFSWTADDPDHPSHQPQMIRYLLKPYESNTDPPVCKTRLEYELFNPIRCDDPLWSDWIPWNTEDDAARLVSFDALPIGSRVLFAVQARDVAGAVTPTFDWGHNVRYMLTTDIRYPLLTIRERILGTNVVASINNFKSYEVTNGQLLEFNWEANAAHYGGSISGYRFGWDVADPDDPQDPGWAVEWGSSPDHLRASASFAQGTHNFVVQCMDNSGALSRFVTILSLIEPPPIPERKPLLFVDDWRNSSADDPLDADWDARWLALLRKVGGFSSSSMLEASTDASLLTLSTAIEHRAIIWFVNFSEQSFYHQRFAPLNLDTPQNHWLESYQQQGGNLLLVGPGAAARGVEDSGWIYPLVFDTPAKPELGFGTWIVDGELRNRGTSRYPYTAWCLESVDRLRPASRFVFGEHDTSDLYPLRTGDCDGLHTAQLDMSFVDQYPEIVDGFGAWDLTPLPERLDPSNQGTNNYNYLSEEIYNSNATRRPLVLSPRPCQIPMFRWRSRRDMDPSLVEGGVENCPPEGSTSSSFDGAPCAVLSLAYESSKPVRRSGDFLWGFHPLSFDPTGVSRALDWVLHGNWQLPMR